MRNSKAVLATGIAALVLGLAACAASTASAPPDRQSSYAEDRAMIEDLQARYLFALDFQDPDLYASTFTEDGVLDYRNGVDNIVGRQAIRDLIDGMRRRAQEQAAADKSGLRPAAGRHHISNIVLKVEGDKAIGRAYWFHTGNNNPERRGALTSFGHYEDELMKIDGKWLFSKRKILNENVADWAAKGGNPAW